MRPSRVSRSLGLLQWYFQLSRPRRWFALAIAVVALASLSIKLLRRTASPHEATTPLAGPNQPKAPAGPPILKLQGSWDLLWKDQRGILLRTHCRIRQDGVALTLYVSDPQLLNLDTQKAIEGTVERKTMSFRVDLRDGTSLVFVGSVDNGVIHGTNSHGLSWMAMKR